LSAIVFIGKKFHNPIIDALALALALALITTP